MALQVGGGDSDTGAEIGTRSATGASAGTGDGEGANVRSMKGTGGRSVELNSRVAVGGTGGTLARDDARAAALARSCCCGGETSSRRAGAAVVAPVVSDARRAGAAVLVFLIGAVRVADAVEPAGAGGSAPPAIIHALCPPPRFPSAEFNVLLNVLLLNAGCSRSLRGLGIL